MEDCGGFGSIDFLVKASGLSDPSLRLVIGLFSGNLHFITILCVDFHKIDRSSQLTFLAITGHYQRNKAYLLKFN